MFEGLRLNHWRPEIGADRILILRFDRQGENVNTLSRAVLEELDQILERIPLEPPKGLIITSAKAAGFIAGADIREFREFAERGQTLAAIERGHRVFRRLSRLTIPSLAAIHGHCMGGGTEIALACRYRLATTDDKTRIGLPEVMLGIMPGWGGTSRLPALIGAPAALDLLLTGRSVNAQFARSIGLVDATCEAHEMIDRAKAILLQRRQRPLRTRIKAWATNLLPVRMVLAQQARNRALRKANPKHYPAPFAMIDFWRRHGAEVDRALRAEPAAVARLAATPTARNLVRVYFLQELLKSLGGGIDHGIRKVHVIGAGVMGGDIAAWCALRGFEVSLQDRELRFIEPALKRAEELFTRKLKTAERIDPVRARLRADVEASGVTDADLIIEAIFENPEAKRALYATLEPRMKPTAILASNTSSIPLTELRIGLSRPERFVGLHYFNPVALMPLVEIVRHDDLDATVEKRLASFARAIDKLPVSVTTTPGFLVNRVLFPYMLEAATLYAEGVPGPVIDKVAKQFGMPMGPIELMDTVGLDVATSVAKVLCPFLGIDVPEKLQFMISEGQRGKKDGHGFYKWREGRAVKPKVPATYQAPADLEDRMILPFLNEAMACLSEGVVANAEQLDAGIIFGTGFAPFRGGPMQYISDNGKAEIRARLEILAQKHGPRFAPKKGWSD